MGNCLGKKSEYSSSIRKGKMPDDEDYGGVFNMEHSSQLNRSTSKRKASSSKGEDTGTSKTKRGTEEDEPVILKDITEIIVLNLNAKYPDYKSFIRKIIEACVRGGYRLKLRRQFKRKANEWGGGDERDVWIPMTCPSSSPRPFILIVLALKKNGIDMSETILMRRQNMYLLAYAKTNAKKSKDYLDPFNWYVMKKANIQLKGWVNGEEVTEGQHGLHFGISYRKSTGTGTDGLVYQARVGVYAMKHEIETLFDINDSPTVKVKQEFAMRNICLMVAEAARSNLIYNHVKANWVNPGNASVHNTIMEEIWNWSKHSEEVADGLYDEKLFGVKCGLGKYPKRRPDLAQDIPMNL